MIVDHVDPLPLDDDTRADGVRIRAHELGLDTPVTAKLKGQPVVAVAQIASDDGGLAAANDEKVRKRIADQVGQRQAVKARMFPVRPAIPPG